MIHLNIISKQLEIQNDLKADKFYNDSCMGTPYSRFIRKTDFLKYSSIKNTTHGSTIFLELSCITKFYKKC